MEYNFENTLSPEQEYYIKEMLYQKYAENFKENGIGSIEQMEICNMAEFMIGLHPEKYARTPGDESNYRRNEHLRNIYAVMNKSADKKINKAVLINLSKEGKMPEGEFGIYDFNTNKFEASTKVKDEIIKYLKIGSLSITKQDEILNTIFKDKDSLESMDKLATMDLEKVIEAKITKDDLQKLISEKIDEENKENGKSPDDRAKIEKEENTKDQKDNEEKETKDLVSPTMMKQLNALGYARVKGVVKTRGSDAADKIEATGINRNAGNVTFVCIKDDTPGKESDKWVAFQGEKLVIYGNKDNEVEKVLGRDMKTKKNGSFIEPVEIESEEKCLKYDKYGMDFNNKLHEEKSMSVEDLENYKLEFDNLVAYYIKRIEQVKEDPLKTHDNKELEYIQINQYFNDENKKIALKYNINLDDMELGNQMTDKKTFETVNEEEEKEKNGDDNIADMVNSKIKDDDEIEAYQVPGKRTKMIP